MNLHSLQQCLHGELKKRLEKKAIIFHAFNPPSFSNQQKRA